MPSQTDHFCLNYGDGFDDDIRETELHVIAAAATLEGGVEREALIKRWMETATVRDVCLTTTPAYFDTDFIGLLLGNILEVFLNEPLLCSVLYETGNLSHVPELKAHVRKAISGTVFDRMDL